MYDLAIDKIHPFSYLSRKEKQSVFRKSRLLEYHKGVVICREGDDHDLDKLYLLYQGSVSISVEGNVIGNIEAPSYFGERAVFFKQSRTATVVANENVKILMISGEHILRLLQKNPSFCYAFSASLRNKQKIFRQFDRFITLLIEKRISRNFQLNELLDDYKKLSPSLHRLCNSKKIDFDALGYAISRLPQNVTTINQLVLSEDLPRYYQKVEREIQVGSVKGVKKYYYKILPGKILIILRDDTTDYIDIITKFCIFQVEMQKIIDRIKNDNFLMEEITDYYFSSDRNYEQQKNIIKKLPLTKHELNKFSEVFLKDILIALYEILSQHNNINCHIMMPHVRYYSTASELWIDQIKHLITENLGKDFLEEDYQVHIISSNTHSVTNCLSHWVHERARKLVNLKGINKNTHDNANRIYSDIKILLHENPELYEEKNDIEKKHGIYHLTNNCLTGININIIELKKISSCIDKHLEQPRKDTNTIIFNIDYAYGKQSETIIRSLILLFGKKIRSVSVFGKAGGVVGSRGELMIPQNFIMQENDVSHNIHNQDLSETDFQQTGCQRRIHKGSMLTVLGTLIQNHEMLVFYRDFWNVVGMEMEGGYFIQEINRVKVQNLIHPDIALRFAYYISDTPLREKESLASKMSMEEGVPAVYAVTRAMLHKIISQDKKK